MENKKVAVIIDGSYLRIEYLRKHKRHIEPKQVVDISKKILDKDELLRIYFYDAEPFGDKIRNPVSGEVKDYRADKTHEKITEFQHTLARMDYVAFRYGRLAFRGWKLRPREEVDRINKQIKKEEAHSGDNQQDEQANAFNERHIKPILNQKMVDVKIGLDIAWLASKRIVDKIIIITGDSDFIPAIKFARKEGVHVVLCSLPGIRPEMKEHADEYKELKL